MVDAQESAREEGERVGHRTGKKQDDTPRNPSGQFAKGKSGNPGGRPKMPDEMRMAFQEASQEALDVLIDVMRNGTRDSDRVRAAEIILERGYGKAVVMEVGPVQGAGGGVIYLPEVGSGDEAGAGVMLEADDV